MLSGSQLQSTRRTGPIIIDGDGLAKPAGGGGMMAGERLDLVSEAAQASSGESSARPFVGIRFACCDVYTRVYINRDVDGLLRPLPATAAGLFGFALVPVGRASGSSRRINRFYATRSPTSCGTMRGCPTRSH